MSVTLIHYQEGHSKNLPVKFIIELQDQLHCIYLIEYLDQLLEIYVTSMD